MALDVDNLRVLVIARDPLARAGLAAILGEQPGIAVVNQLAWETAHPNMLEEYRPDVALWDLGWDPAQALESLADLLDVDVPTVVLLSDSSRASEVWAAGAMGVLHRDADADSLVAALRAVSHGLSVLHPELSFGAFAPRPQGSAPLHEGLTPREAQVLKLLAEGLPNKAIADNLRISEHTVKFHVNAILGKLGAQTRTEAVVYATRLGLVPL